MVYHPPRQDPPLVFVPLPDLDVTDDPQIVPPYLTGNFVAVPPKRTGRTRHQGGWVDERHNASTLQRHMGLGKHRRAHACENVPAKLVHVKLIQAGGSNRSHGMDFTVCEAMIDGGAPTSSWAKRAALFFSNSLASSFRLLASDSLPSLPTHSTGQVYW